MTATTTETTIDWEKCWQLATQLGAHTRALIVEHDYEGAREWALQMISQQGDGSPVNSQRALSYFELAILLGHRANEVQEDARLDWDSLLAKVSTLQRSVQEKVDAEKAAADKAKAEAKAAAAAQEAEPDEQEEMDGDERDGS